MIGEVKEEDDEEDGRASPPPFQPGPSYSDRVTSVGVTLPPMTGKYLFYNNPTSNLHSEISGQCSA